MKKDTILKLLNAYGFHSINKDPFLYIGKLGIGFAYSFRDAYYETLKRVYIPKDEVDANNFLKRLYWYRKYGLKFKVTFQLDDYKIENPNYSLVKDGEVLEDNTLEKLIHMVQKKDNSYLLKLRRTVSILCDVIKNKIDLQNITYQNILKVYNDYQDLSLNYMRCYQDATKKKQDILIDKLEDISLVDQTNEINTLKKELLKQDTDKLLESIKVLTNTIYQLESDQSFIHNKYELIKYPLKIQVLKNKIDYLQKSQKKVKPGIIDGFLKKIEQQSDLEHIVSFQSYYDNEIKRLKEKYEMVPNLDARTVGDYFVEFDNLNIDYHINSTESEVSYEQTMECLEESYVNRSEEEKKILIVYHSILNNIIYNIDISSLVNPLIEEFISLINDYNNTLIKVKYFRTIDMSSIESCKTGLIKLFQSIKQIKEDSLLSDITVFFQDGKKILNPSYLTASNKRSLTPYQRIENNDITYIASLKKNSLVYFVPEALLYDLENDNTIVLKENLPYFVIDLKKNVIKEENSDILKVVSYEMNVKKDETISYVETLKSVEVKQYKKILIERKLENE